MIRSSRCGCGSSPRARERTSLKKIDAEIRKIVAEAADFATADKEPDPSELYTDVLA